MPVQGSVHSEGSNNMTTSNRHLTIHTSSSSSSSSSSSEEENDLEGLDQFDLDLNRNVSSVSDAYDQQQEAYPQQPRRIRRRKGSLSKRSNVFQDLYNYGKRSASSSYSELSATATSSSHSTQSICADTDSTSTFGKMPRLSSLSHRVAPTTSLPLLVLIDMFAVSLVVPLLFQYYKQAGVKNAAQRELLSSIFSVSQIVGGITFGVLTDAKLVHRRTILLMSFAGSSLSYAMIVRGGLYTILLSRVLVGLVKQTMTVTTTMLTKNTSSEDRAQHMGRLTAASTVAWIVGPSTGALLYKYVDTRAPALLACALFVVNLVLATLLLGDEDDNERNYDFDRGDDHRMDVENDDTVSRGRKYELKQQTLSSDSSLMSKESLEATSLRTTKSGSKKSGVSIILFNLRSCFSSRALGAAVLTKLLMTWCTSATSYSQLGSFYEDMYGLEPHHRGYISSYQQLLRFVVNLVLVAPILSWTGGERRAICLCMGGLAFSVWLESRQSLPLFLALLCPIISLSFAISNLSIQTLVTHVAPSSSIFSVLAALDVLQNAVSVSVPFYRTWLFRLLASDTAEHAMQGDPDPKAWVQASALHWVIAFFVMSFLLLYNDSWWKVQENQNRGPNDGSRIKKAR